MANFDLKPCPFCGGTAHIRDFGGRYSVSCSGCGATGGAVWVKQWHSTKFIAQGQAAKLWNERAVNGAGMATLQKRDAVLEALWKQLDDVPMNPETEELEAAFLHFPAGTNRLEVWHWFDDRYSKGVSFLLYGIQADGRRCEIVWDIQKQNDIEDVQSYIDQLTDDEIRQEYRMERKALCKLVQTAAAKMRKLIDDDDSWTFLRDTAIKETAKEYLKGRAEE